MTAQQLYSKTMPFVWAKLVLGLATVLISVALFAVLMGIGWLFGDGSMGVAILIWLAGTGVVRFVILHYIGYLVKAGHVAVIAEAFRTGQVPADPVAAGKAMVTQRFATSNLYFAVDKLVAGAVRQIQRGIEKVGSALDFIPGMQAVTGLAKFFVDISLGYIDECCLGWTFYNPDQGAFQSAADGVVIYAQNWKKLLKDAAKTMAMVVGVMAVVILVVFVVLGLLFKLLHWSPLVAFLLACLVAFTIKSAFIDSLIMVKMMTSYLEAAPATQITFDLYGKLSAMSSSFQELFQKGQQESPSPAYAAAAPAGAAPAPGVEKPLFCGQCGAKNETGAAFCGACGAKLG